MVDLLSMGSNDFTGAIPDEICSLVDDGQLSTLVVDCDGLRGSSEVFCPCCTSCVPSIVNNDDDGDNDYGNNNSI